MRTLAAILVVATSAVALCQQVKTSDADWKVPEKAEQQQNPLREKPELAAGGRKIFDRNCMQCHGDATHERKNNAPDLASAEVQQQSDGALFWRMSSGNARKGMPSFSGLPEAQRWQLVLYIRSMSSKP
ncbi:MAG TPA: c-type cytochrome [Terriglobales bacterium]|nr:c-type cytochrome [Terriglobales bacterium]